ncbi:MAG: phosphohistidine phosphatase SixA [Gammaproteobacteria bacterium]|nr:phosphohistidine phosphatase SixA [Gammaproteobacteria bacterium]
MKLLLMQHGEALSRQDDINRPLSDKGKNDIQRMANFLGNANISIDRVIHSGKTRAEQTASIIASGLSGSCTIQQVDFINPNDDVDDFLNRLDPQVAGVMVVGHLPFLARLVAHLSVNDSSKSVVAYVPGSMVCLENNEDDEWEICWMIRPELV